MIPARLHPVWLIIAAPLCLAFSPFIVLVVAWNWAMPSQYHNAGLNRPL